MKRRKDPPGYEGDAAFNWAFSEVAKQIRAASGLTDQQIVENIKKARTNPVTARSYWNPASHSSKPQAPQRSC